jgi:ABC-type polysaccharide/polyol phosphate transport system ATPase subunit
VPEPVILAEGLGKSYTLASTSERYHTIRDRFSSFISRRDRAKNHAEPFWALRDVSFEVFRGEVLGIIGRNGAGKSTLLKILSRITEPTLGRLALRGRVASLLEVGTGFHPELSGRENIFLNGAVLGMTKREIAAKFDEIVAFAEVERFLDTPVKRYSSGMHVRLAFAVAAHLEPEVLVVDEVLAVGDAAFREKCLGKMRTVTRESGCTVFFVSHNLSTVRQLCSRCLWMDAGRLLHDGSPDEAITHYLRASHKEALSEDVSQLARPYGSNGQARLTGLRLIEAQTSLVFEASIDVSEYVADACISFTVYTQEGIAVGSGFSAELDLEMGAQKWQVSVLLPCLAVGKYHCTVALSRGSCQALQLIDAVSDVVPFQLTANERAIPWHSEWGPLQFTSVGVIRLS